MLPSLVRPLLPLTFAIGCGASSPSAGDARVARPAAPAVPAAPAGPPAAPNPPAEPLASADAEPGASADERHRLRLAAWRDGALGLFLAPDDRVLVAGAAAVAESAPGEDLSRRPDMLDGLTDPGELTQAEWQAVALGGRWPAGATLTTALVGPRGPAPAYHVHVRRGDRWQRRDNVDGPVQWYYAGFAPWRDDQVLALRRAVLAAHLGDASPAAHARHVAALADAPPRLVALDPSPGVDPPELPEKHDIRAFAARPTGEVDVLAVDEQGVPLLLRWDPDAAAPQRSPLPSQEGDLPEPAAAFVLAAHRDGGLWVGGGREGGGPYLARFDGDAWSLRTLAAAEPVVSLAAGGDGTLWAVTAPSARDAGPVGALWRSPDGERFDPVAVPAVRFPDLGEPRWAYDPGSGYTEHPADPAAAATDWPVAPRGVLARGDGEVWVHGRAAVPSARDVVLRSGAVATPLALPSDPMLRLELLDERPLKEHDPGAPCDGAQLPTVLWPLADDADAAAQLDRLLAAHPTLAAGLVDIWEVRHRGRRAVAFRGLADRPHADALIAALGDDGDRRVVACRLPVPVRPLRTRAQLAARPAGP
jgi:hypothetical protein